jgi:hypothetical protein
MEKDHFIIIFQSLNRIARSSIPRDCRGPQSLISFGMVGTGQQKRAAGISVALTHIAGSRNPSPVLPGAWIFA